jgi:hypothetical protein
MLVGDAGHKGLRSLQNQTRLLDRHGEAPSSV